MNVLKIIHNIQVFVVENAKTARHFLKAVGHPLPLSEIEIYEMDKHEPESQRGEIEILLKTHSEIGVMSEAGLPCIADPGTHVVRMAHRLGIKVKPLTGPSSILLALVASGLNGQNFRFTGYIPPKAPERKAAISKLESESQHCTQLFIEAPYRNDHLLDDLCQNLKPETMLLVAIDLTGINERIVCQTAAWWKINKFVIGKVPCLFGIGK